MPEATEKPRDLARAIQILILLLVLLIYAQTAGFGFLNWDDPLYAGLPQIQAGLTWESVRWSFSSTDTANWSPLTLMSHMLDFTLFGNRPGLHHLMNLALHAANSLLWFSLFRSMAVECWKSALLALVFAVHPTHVESVAWISERKDLLSTLLMLLCLKSYVGWVQAPTPRRYAAVLGWFALGLMAKAMLVTLPLLLLLLDGWPLGRLQDGTHSPRTLLLEKAPLFLLSGALGLITIWAQAAGNAVMPLSRIPLQDRMLNASWSYVRYTLDFVLPVRLSAFHPLREGGQAWLPALLSLLAWGAVLAFAAHRRRDQPVWLVGALWYLVSLLPVIGILQVGSQSHADRYSYLPQMGLCLLAIHAAEALFARLKTPLPLQNGVAVVWIGLLTFGAWIQVGTWRDSLTLWREVQAQSPPSSTIQINLGEALLKAGRPQEALLEYQVALRIRPDQILTHLGQGDALIALGRPRQALQAYLKALALDPGSRVALFKTAQTALAAGDLSTGEACMEKFFASEQVPTPLLTEADRIAGGLLRVEAGRLALVQGEATKAESLFLGARQRLPDDEEASVGLAKALWDQGRSSEAIAVIDGFLRAHPGSDPASALLQEFKAKDR